MPIEGIDGEWLWRHVGIEADCSVDPVNGEDIQGNVLAEDVDGVLGPCKQMVIIPLVFHDDAVDIDAVVVFFPGVQIEDCCDRGHGVASLWCDYSDKSLVALGTGIVGRVIVGIDAMAIIAFEIFHSYLRS